MASIRFPPVSRTPLGEGAPGTELAAEVVEHQQTGIAVLDAERRVICWNRWIADWTGVSPEQALRRRLDDIFPRLAGGELLRTLAQVVETGTPLCWSQQLDPERLDRLEAEMTPGDRELPPLRLSLSRVAVPGGSGSLLEVVEAPFQPLSAAQRPAAEPSGPGHLVYLDHSGAGILELDAKGRIRGLNEALCALTGFSTEQLRGAPARLIFPDLERGGEAPLARLQMHARNGGLLRAATAEGDPRWLAVVPCTPLPPAAGLVLVCRDASPQLVERDRAQLQGERVAALLAEVADAVLLVDALGLVERVNPVALELVGTVESMVTGRPVEQLLSLQPAVSGAPALSVRAALAAGVRLPLPPGTALRRGDGEVLPVAGSLTPLRDRDNKLAGGVLVLRVGAESRPESRRLAWQAEHDSLTGLPNRTALAKAIATQLERMRSGAASSAALLYIDLFNFSLVNDTCGHAAGDTLLRQAARALERHAQTGDQLARVGNDEFALLLRDADADSATRVAESVLGEFADFTFPWGERRVKVGISLGWELFDCTAESDIDVLVAAAANCSKAREQGRNRMCCPAGRSGDTRGDGLSLWIPRISEALEEHRFRLFLQPIVALGAATAGADERHCEALMRMIGREGELISPQSFIPAAERYGLIDDLDRWAVAEAVRLLQRLSGSLGAGFKLSVNLSGATISDDSSADFILGVIDRSGVDPRRLQFEITETTAIRQFDRALALIHRLRSHGCYLALDDFGSGLSSLRYLQEIPVDFLKIDGAFIRRIELSEVDLAMVDTINDLAHIMGIRTVAESVENANQLNLLRQLGVDYAQGFHIAMPQAPEELFATALRRGG